MTSSIKVKRGDVVLLPISFVSGVGTQMRPAVARPAFADGTFPPTKSFLIGTENSFFYSV